jgi:DNA gyrase subunit A
VRGIDLADQDSLVGLVRVEMRDEDDASSAVHPEIDLLTLTANGYGKRTALTEYLVQSEGEDGAAGLRVQSRGGKGRIDIRTTERNGPVVAVKAVADGQGVVLVSEGGLLVRIPIAQVSRIGRNTQGVRVVSLKEGDRLVAAAVVPASQAGPEGDAPPSAAQGEQAPA